jgi:succinoglycan biosynthesis transport protein ExoP
MVSNAATLYPAWSGAMMKSGASAGQGGAAPGGIGQEGVQEGAPDGDIDLRSLGAALRRRKHWVIWPTLLAAIAAAVVVNVLSPRYKSEARIVYDGRENVFLRPEADKSVNQDRGPADAETLTNQIQIVLSRPLALEVIDELKLNDLPEFDPVLKGISTLRRFLQMAGISRDLLAMTPEERVLSSWYDLLTAYSLDKSRVIVIEFQSGDPVLAARIASAIADAYLRMQQAVRQDQTRGAGAWLSNEIEKLRPKVAEAEAKADAFRSRTSLFVGTNNTTLSNQQLGEFNSQLAAARGQKADAETRARIIRDMLRRGEPIEASDVVNSELIRRLSEQRVTLRAQLAEQSSTLLDGHPRIKELRAQIADLDHQIKAEAEKLIRALENDARIADARVDALSQNFDVLKRQAATSNEQDVELRALEREAKAQRDLLESYLARYRETTARDTIGNAPPDAKIISQAVVSNTPAFPKKVPIIAVATLIAFVLSAGLVTTGELLRATARPYRVQGPSSEPLPGDIEPRFGDAELPRVTAEMAPTTQPELTEETHAKLVAEMAAPDDAALGSRAQEGPAPDHPAPRNAPAEVPPLANTPPAQAAAESVAPHLALGVPLAAVRDVARRLRENVDAGRGIALFGAMADVPTTLPALTLARALSTDSKVVLISLARSPVLAAISTWPNMPGLTDVVRGTASFGHIIGRDRLSRVHLINHGQADLPLATLVNSRHFRVMVEALARAYTHVIVDAGRLGVDCFHLAALAPRCVLIAPEDAAREIAAACQMLSGAGFADITVMSRAAVAAPHGLEAA